MSVISTRGTMHFTVFADRFTTATCITFLKRVIGNFPEQKIHLIVDRHPVHRSKKVTAWVAEHTDSIELHLPAVLCTAPQPRRTRQRRPQLTSNVNSPTRSSTTGLIWRHQPAASSTESRNSLSVS
ncbi:transposase, partial [Streptomyces calidiresistens]